MCINRVSLLFDINYVGRLMIIEFLMSKSTSN